VDPQKEEKTSQSEYVPPDMFELGDAKELTRGNGTVCIDSGAEAHTGCPADV
jgi:hypothetical protein